MALWIKKELKHLFQGLVRSRWNPQQLENINQVVAEPELINIVESLLQNSSGIVLDMKGLNFVYNILEKTGVNYKQHFK